MVVLVDSVGDFPINDDWVYGAATRSVLQGRLAIHGASSANVGLLAYWGALFSLPGGFSFTALRLSTIVLGLAGGWAVYFVVLRFWSHRAIALTIASAFLVNPVYFALANTFMTDIPFFALLVMASGSMLKGIDQDDNRWVVAGLFIALCAVTIRQFALVALVGFAFMHVGRRGVSVRSVAIALTPLLVGLLIHALLTTWLVDTGRKLHPTGVQSAIEWPLTPKEWGRLKWSSLVVVGNIGLFVLPIAALCAPSKAIGRHARLVACLAVAVLAGPIAFAFVQRGLTLPLGENMLFWYGIGPRSSRDTYELKLNLPSPGDGTMVVLWVVTALAIVAAAFAFVTLAVGLVRLVRDLRRNPRGPQSRSTTRWLLIVGIGSSYAAILVVIASQLPVFDRYLLPLVFVIALALPLMIAGEAGPVALSRTRVAIGAALLLASCVFSVVTTHDFLAWSRTRWTALQELTAQGIGPERIDGGYEFNGWYLYDPLYRYTNARSWWWVIDDEYVATSGPLPGYDTLRTFPVDRWWKEAGGDVFIVHRH